MKENKPRTLLGFTARQWAAVALLIAAGIFILQNLYRVRVQIFFFHTAAPLWSVILGTLIIGYLVGRFSVRR